MNHKEGLRLGVDHVRSMCPVMRRGIDNHRPITLRPAGDRFGILVRSIISQQISTAAARTIRARLESHLKSTGVTPAALARQTEAKLRAAGISRQKASYLVDLARKVDDGTVPLAQIGRQSD